MAPKSQLVGHSPASSFATSTANAMRWLDVIRHAEGSNYNTRFGGGSYDHNKPHPGTVYTSKSGRQSAAHGAYQFMPDTWKEINGGKNVPMTSQAQDAAALRLMERAGVSPNAPFTRQNVAKLAATWASLPNEQGQSAYKQPVKDFNKLQQVFNNSLKINTPNQQGHYNPQSVGKAGPTYVVVPRR